MDTQLNFWEALALLIGGNKLSRKWWNGNGMYIYYVPAQNYVPTTDVAKKEFIDTVPYNAYLAIKTVDNTVSMWTITNMDALAEDRFVLE